MPKYRELSDPYANFMLDPAPAGPGVCPTCRGFTTPGYGPDDRGCAFSPAHIDAMSAISYEPALGQLHTALRGYKDDFYVRVQNRFTLVLASILWRFLEEHERCLAAAAGTGGFTVVTTVPSKTPERDESRDRLRDIVGRLCQPTSGRYERVLAATGLGSSEREFDAARFRASRLLDGARVLLIDDTWTTGSDAQSAAYALKDAGATIVGCAVIGRYIVPEYEDHGKRLSELPRPFRWDICAHHSS